jgi:hypothetical protein
LQLLHSLLLAAARLWESLHPHHSHLGQSSILVSKAFNRCSNSSAVIAIGTS